MPSPQSVTLTLERRLLEHPRAYHLRRMRQGVWLYLALASRVPAGAETLEIDPVALGQDMGLPEGTVRSWLGHLRKAGYLDVHRLNGTLRVTIRKGYVPEPPAREPERFFTLEKLQRMLKDKLTVEPFEAALRLYSDPVIRKALAGALAPPADQIRRSRTALFLYLLKRHPHAPNP